MANIETTASNDPLEPLEAPSDSNKTQQPLTTKNAIEFLLNGTLQNKVCRYCLNVTSQLEELDMIVHIGGQRALYQITIKDMIANFYPFQVSQDPELPNKICDCCLDRTIRTYLFTQQCEQSGRALRNCFDHIHEKVEKLDPLERKSKRGKQKLNPNHDKIYAAHDKVIDYAEPIIHLVNRGSALINNENTPKVNELECLKCWQLLPNVESLLNHDKIHPKSMWYHCRQCGGSFAKHLHLKRHVKSQHAAENETLAAPNNQTFECQTCGDISDTHQNYIQHMEKHKLKKVLRQVLLEKNDELCTVCLNKENKMVDLETMMALNGTCPELHGDKSLYHIVGSALPHHKETYKYQELLVSRTAKILKLTQKTTETNKNENAFNKAEKTFLFAHPVKMINVTLDLKGKSYTYGFPKPSITVNNVEEELHDVKEHVGSKEGNSFVFSHPTKRIKLTLDLEGNSYTFGFPKPNRTVKYAEEEMPDVVEFEKREENAVTKEDIVENKHNLCKTCWIFTTPQCEECALKSAEGKIKSLINGNKNVMTQNIKDPANPCSYCWLYKNLEKCDFCQKLNVKNPKDTNENETKHETEELSTKEKPVVTNSMNNIAGGRKRTMKDKPAVNDSVKNSPGIKKRTINDLSLTAPIETPVKKLIWQCHVCFTPNESNRKKCICCESDEFIEQANKINFGCRKDIPFEIPVKITDCSHNNEVKEPSEIEIREENNNDYKLLNNANIKDIDGSEMMDTNTSSNTQIRGDFSETAVVDPKGTELMEVNYEDNTNQETMQRMPTVPFFTGCFEKTLIPSAQEIMPTIENTGSPLMTLKSCNFNMGSGVVVNKALRRNKRSIRTLHK